MEGKRQGTSGTASRGPLGPDYALHTGILNRLHLRVIGIGNPSSRALSLSLFAAERHLGV